jgi:hypothetical protein
MRAALAVAVVAACTPGVKMTNLPVCTTLAECNAHHGERVIVTGVYALYQYMAPTQLPDDQVPVRIELAGEPGPIKGPMLGVFWMASVKRPPAEIARLKGKRVRVIGTFLRDQPLNPDHPDMSTVGGPCVHPVESVDAE